MLPGEQESAKKTIRDEDDCIICRVKLPRGDTGVRTENDRNYQEITDFLESHGTRLEGIKLKGTKTQRLQKTFPEEDPRGVKDGTAPTTSER